MAKLLQQHYDEVAKLSTKSQTKPIPFTNNTNLNEANVNKAVESSNVSKEKSENTFNSNNNNNNKNISQNKSNEPKENINTGPIKKPYEQSRPERIVRNNKITILNTKPSDDVIITNFSDSMTEERNSDGQIIDKNPKINQVVVRTNLENSNASNFSRSGGSNSCGETNANIPQIQNQIDNYCLLCQDENNPNLISCGNQACKRALCHKCLLIYLQNSQKCPGCKLMIDIKVQTSLRDNRSSSSSSTSPNRINQTQPHINENLLKRLDFSTSVSNNNSNTRVPSNRAPNNNNYNSNYSHNVNNNSNPSSGNGGFYNGNANSSKFNPNKHVSNGEPKMKLEIIDEPCGGYEGFKSYLITFEISGGIQNVRASRRIKGF
jgi:hypothetical protein